MLKDIIIIDDETEEEIKPDNDKIILPYGKEKFEISVNEAKNIINILQGQLNIIEEQKKLVSTKSNDKHTTRITRETGCDIRGA